MLYYLKCKYDCNGTLLHGTNKTQYKKNLSNLQIHYTRMSVNSVSYIKMLYNSPHADNTVHSTSTH